MRDEEHALEYLTGRIEGSQPGFAEPGREDNEPSFVADKTRGGKGCKGFLLNRVRLWYWFWHFLDHLDHAWQSRWLTTMSIGRNPIVIDMASA